MRRYTKLLNPYGYVVDDKNITTANHGYSGEAIRRLAAYEDMYHDLLSEQEHIEKQIYILRVEGKDNTLAIRQLIGKKMVNNDLLSLLNTYVSEEIIHKKQAHG